MADFIERAQKAGYLDHRDYLAAFVSGEISPDLATRKVAVQSLGHLGKINASLTQIARATISGRMAHLSPEEVNIIKAARAAILQTGNEIREALRR
ncbi:hypothetical protein [Roseovarius aquimarinus]|uniref:HEAT repeat domain-containing protein n=2 Tax=Roseovarius aquimarinus TaxID=1229156 RepID=A0ABW7IB81_9RHOB